MKNLLVAFLILISFSSAQAQNRLDNEKIIFTRPESFLLPGSIHVALEVQDDQGKFFVESLFIPYGDNISLYNILKSVEITMLHNTYPYKGFYKHVKSGICTISTFSYLRGCPIESISFPYTIIDENVSSTDMIDTRHMSKDYYNTHKDIQSMFRYIP